MDIYPAVYIWYGIKKFCTYNEVNRHCREIKLPSPIIQNTGLFNHQSTLVCMFKYILLWLPLLLIAIMNGVLREAFLKKYVTHELAHQLSAITLILFHAIYMWYILKGFPPSSSEQAITIGIVWLTLTLAFEFGFGRYRGLSWATLLDEYKIWKGRIWILVLIWVTIAPVLFYKRYKP